VYSAAKAAVIQLTRTVAMELGEHNIRVNCICPGGIATPISARGWGFGRGADAIVPLMKGVLENVQPIKRSGLPEDIAQAALWLASDDSTFVNGHALVLDGGLSGGRSCRSPQFRRAALRQALGCRRVARDGSSVRTRASVWPPRRRGERHARPRRPAMRPSPSVSPWPHLA